MRDGESMFFGIRIVGALQSSAHRNEWMMLLNLQDSRKTPTAQRVVEQ